MDIRLPFPPPMLINLCYLKRETGKHKYQMVPQMWPILYLNCRQKNLLIFHVWSTGKLKLVLLSSSIRLVDFVADEQLCFSLATPALLLWPSQSIPHPSSLLPLPSLAQCLLGIPLCPTVRELMLGSSQRATIYIAHGEANPNLPCVLLHLTKNAL